LHPLDDLRGGVVPHERLRIVVPTLGPQEDRVDQVGHTGKGAPTQPLVGELFEPSLDLVEPTGVERQVVEVEPVGVSRLPDRHGGAAVSVEIVDDGMDHLPRGDVSIETVEEAGGGLLGVTRPRTWPVWTSRPAVRQRVPCRT